MRNAAYPAQAPSTASGRESLSQIDADSGTTQTTTQAILPSTSVTTTAVLSPPNRLFVSIVSGGTIACQELRQVNLVSLSRVIAELLYTHCERNSGRRHGVLRLVQALPRHSDTYAELLLIWHPLDFDIHVVIDCRALGGGLSHEATDPDADPAQLIRPEYRLEDIRIFINGIPHALFHGPLQDGDLIAVFRAVPNVPAVPRSAFFRKWPALGLLGLDIETPNLQHVPATPHALFAAFCQCTRDALDNHAIRLGHWIVPGRQAIVHNRNLGDILLYVQGRLPVGREQVVEALRLITTWQDIHEVTDTRHMSLDASVFVARDPFERRSVFHLIPVPYMPQMQLLWPTAPGLLASAHLLPAQPHLQVESTEQPLNGHVHTLRRRDLAEPSEGTSLVQIQRSSIAPRQRPRPPCADLKDDAPAGRVALCLQEFRLPSSPPFGPAEVGSSAPPPSHGKHAPEGLRQQVATPLGRRTIATSATGTPIALCKAVPETTTAEDVMHKAFKALSMPWLRFWNRNVTQIPQLPAEIAAYLSNLPPLRDAPARLHLFTDGSFGKLQGISNAGWAVVTVLETVDSAGQHLHLVGWQGGSTTEFAKHAVGADFSSYSAEVQAAIVACAWLVSVPPACSVCVWTDNSSVFKIINGTASPAATVVGRLSLPERLRCLAQLVGACGHSWEARWLPGHKGNPFNELADRVAKHKATEARPESCLPHAFWTIMKSPLLPWIWMLPNQPHDLPGLERLCSGLYEPPDPVPDECFPRNPVDQTVQLGQDKQATLELRLVSYNALSLLDSRDIVLQQMVDRKANIVGLQETRSRTATQCRGRHFFEFASAAKAGEGGCSLFFSKHVPYAKLNGTPLHFVAEHFRCVLADHRRIAVTITAPCLRAICVAAHAPHSGTPRAEIEKWWQELQSDIAPLAKGRECLCLFDANAQVGTVTDEAIGEHAASAETVAGTLFREWLNAFALFAPATFFDKDGACVPSCCEPTWTSHKGSKHRIDYIAVPRSWQDTALRPEVLVDFTTTTVDHWPVQLDCRQYLGTRQRLPAKNKVGLPSDADLVDEAPKHALLQAVLNLPCAAWEANIHKHTQSLYDAIAIAAQEAKRLFPKERKCRPFLSPLSRFWLECERALGKACRTLDRLNIRCTLGTIFRAWKRVAPFRTREGWSLAQVQQRRQRAICLRKHAQRKLKHSVVQDKAAFINWRFAGIHTAAQPFDAKAFFKAIASLRPRSKRVRKPFQPLIVDPSAAEDGSIELAQAQASHFAALEGGTPITPQAYVHDANARYAARVTEGHFELRDLPTLVGLERALRGAKNGKAPGPNAIPEWVWKLDVPAAARALYPIYLKTHIRLCEPVQFKSTCLIAMFKGKGALTCVANFRAIALMDGPGKHLRKGIRQDLINALPDNDLLQGGIPGSLLQAAHHVVRAYTSLAAHAQISSAVLFLDVASAYYRVLRQSFWEHELEDDVALCELLRRLNVAPESVHEVCSWISSTNLLQQAPAHTSRIIREFLAGTFFHMRGAPGVTSTAAGTRPGDSVADLLFALVQADFLRDAQNRLECDGLLEDPVQQRANLGGRLVSPVWADDTAMMFADADATRLLPRMQAALAHIHAGFIQRGMQPNYNRGKTELMMAFRGRGAPAMRRRIHVWNGGIIHFQDHHRHSVPVCCVRSYQHLGGRVEDKVTVLNDVVQHLASGMRQVRPLARPFLRNPRIPLASRRLCLQSLALSAASCTSATWDRMTRQESDTWRRGYVALHRLLAKDDRWTGAPSLPNEETVCRFFQSPSPCAFLRGQRLLHFGRCMPAQETLFALLKADFEFGAVSWLGLLQEDAAWLAQLTKVPSAILQDFPTGLLRWAVEAPAALRTAVRKALAAVHRDEHEPAWRAPKQHSAEGPANFQCSLCHRSFASQQRLSAHCFAQHKIRCEAAQRVSGSTCPVCYTQFWTHGRLCRHLQHDSLTCLARIVEHDYRSPGIGSPPKPDPCQTLPAVRLIGPPLPLAQPIAELAVQIVEDPDFAERIRQGWHSPAVARWLEATESTD